MRKVGDCALYNDTATANISMLISLRIHSAVVAQGAMTVAQAPITGKVRDDVFHR